MTKIFSIFIKLNREYNILKQKFKFPSDKEADRISEIVCISF